MTLPLRIDEYEATARDVLSTMVYDYYAGGAHDEVTLRANREAYERYRLQYRVLREVGGRTTSIEILGTPVAMPILIAPTAFQQMANPEGEVATARAAAGAGTIMVLSTLSTRPIEEVAAASGGRLWFQLYVYRDRALTADLVRRAEAAGATALVVTVDAPVWGVRERDVRNRFQLPQGLRMANLVGTGRDTFPHAEGSGLAAYVGGLFEESLGWRDVDWLCAQTRLPVLIKGVARGDDAALGVEHGAAGIIVSNHGGRQLDGAPPTIEVLEEVAEGVAGRAALLVDGGIRRGTDVVKALALGADAVLVGRPILWGLAAGGERGVAGVLEILRSELDLAMGLCGARSIGEITRDLVR
jgi:4-hydroxymandelate oxidase